MKTENRVAAKSLPSDDMHSTTEQEAVATWPLRNTQLKLNSVVTYSKKPHNLDEARGLEQMVF
ncbi:MAG: hypothetical protein M3Q91_19360 [Acidobacteriota bacterium]|nr:hypothetical protein [Acidobacteriota bacterium]